MNDHGGTRPRWPSRGATYDATTKPLAMKERKALRKAVRKETWEER